MKTKVDHGTSWGRIMHAIGGFTGKNDNSEMVFGSEDVLKLISEKELKVWQDSGIDVQRLVNLGAIRQATPEEVSEWFKKEGLQADDFEDEGDEAHFNFLADQVEDGEGKAPEAPVPGQTYKNMTKGELSEFNVPELKDMAKEEGVDGYGTMVKDDLLTALLALGK